MFYTYFLLTILGSFSAYFGGRGLLRGLASRNWPTTDGIITSSLIQLNRVQHPNGFIVTSPIPTYSPSISFEYSVGVKKYSSKTYTLTLGPVFFDAKSVENITRKYPIGSHVKVFYNPKNPKISLLEPGLKSIFGYTGSFILGLISLIAVLMGWILYRSVSY